MKTACLKFRSADFSSLMAPETSLHADFMEHSLECEDCASWYRQKKLSARGINPDEYCCLSMAEQLTHACEIHPDPWDCPDHLVVHLKKGKKFALPIHDGGRSYFAIAFCPWCGHNLGQDSEG